MSINDIIRSWKSDDDDTDGEKDGKDEKLPKNPAGVQELTDEELEIASGGVQPTTFSGIVYNCGPGTTR